MQPLRSPFLTSMTGDRNNGDHHRVKEAFEASLAALGTNYIDLYLVHWPQAVVDGRTLKETESPTIVDTWKDMEKLLDTGSWIISSIPVI
jgi:glycerol 2-dehydrogenase (NADP+)